MKKIKYNKYPERICKSVHFCNLCDEDIKYGEKYYDGGYNKRVHVKCYLKFASNQVWK